MPTRFNSRSNRRFGVSGIDSGYGGQSTSDDLTIPSVGVEDVDAALFQLFDKEIPLHVSVSDKNRAETQRVPVVFAAAEKWALSKRQRALRDKQGSLILPLITVVRTTVQQTPNDDISGRGINQQTGEITVTRRLDKSDRAYQSLLNKLLLNNQDNLAVTPDGETSLTTLRDVGELATDPTVVDGGFLASNLSNNVFETLTLPSPQFFTAVYDVTLWTQYTIQMSQLLETLISSFLPQGSSWRLDTAKGYWFIATVDGNLYNAENNLDDMSQEERMIKYKFTIKVPGYILATGVPGAPVPLKRYISSPSVTFDMGVDQTISDGLDDPFLGSDDPTLPLTDRANNRLDQRETNRTRLYPSRDVVSSEDPALLSVRRGQPLPKYKTVTVTGKNGKQTKKYVRISSTNTHTGETTFSGDFDLGGLVITVADD